MAKVKRLDYVNKLFILLYKVYETIEKMNNYAIKSCKQSFFSVIIFHLEAKINILSEK